MKYIEISEVEKKLQKNSLHQLEFYNLLEFISKYAISEKAKQIILDLEPISNFSFLNNELNSIEELKITLTSEDNIPFEGINDVQNSLQKSLVENSILNSAEILRINRMMKSARVLKSYFQNKDEKYPNIWNSLQFININRLLEKHISETIDDTAEIKSTASRELQRIRSSIIDKTNRLRYRLEKILIKATKDSVAAEEYISIRDGRFVIPIKAEHKRNIPGIIHNVSQTGATVFLEPSETFEMNNEISLLKNEENREVTRILKNLTQEIGNEARELLQTFDIIVHFDTLLARAKYALDYGGIKPVISDENEIELINIKHPILCHTKGVKNVIPLSTIFNSSKRGQLISGPNAGGKTVALKSIGINVIMALSGIFPLGECKTNYRILFSSIGDHQSIENDLSTFSSQLFQLKNIIDNCSQYSLILIDEICSGTDPYEGSALAAGILDTFIESNAFFIVTTHQSSLKTYSLNKSEIENASLEFNEAKLKPTYKYLLSTPGNSYAFELSKNIGLSNLVLNRAKKYLGKDHSKVEESIKLLQKYKFEAEEYKNSMLQEKNKSERLRIDYENRLKEIKQKKKELIEKARYEALDILNSANSLIEKTIKDVREEKKPIADIKKDFESKKSTIKNKAKKDSIENKAEAENFILGDIVKIIDSDTDAGSIIAIYDNSDDVLVDFDGLKFKINKSKLVKSKKKPKAKKETYGYFKLDAQTRLDLRGRRADESIREIDNLINDALVSNIGELTIVHGKGTGALRLAIHNYLKDHPSVASYRLGELVEGGDGVTIIQL